MDGKTAGFEIGNEDITYRRDGGIELLARLYRPIGAPGPLPAIVEVHGGAWTSGERTQNVAIHRALAATGIVVMALDFRMPPVAAYPASIADINFAIRWLKAHARDFGSRAELVGGLGASSGGHQIMTAALRPRDPAYTALPMPESASIDAGLAYVVLGWPVLDPLVRYHMAQSRGMESMVQAHNAFFGTEAKMIEANPQLIVERGEAQSLPPTLILQGTKDENIPDGMAARFAEGYRRAGGTVDLHHFDGQPHSFVTKDPAAPASQEALALMQGFIHRQAAAITARA